ncbi:MAG: TatD family deoxyribonuclease [Planctomycetota bacterium]|nr:MAG: TatD family deoxyribonuclease [Planctomycetota bacterium]
MPNALPPLIDTHCHLTHQRFQDDCHQVIDDAQAAGIAAMITIGTGVADGIRGSEIAAAWPQVIYTACGLDPFTLHERADSFADDLAALDAHLASAGCVALGEIGLEYFHRVLTPVQQQERLHAQLALAERRQLPVVIHVRDAHPDMKAVLAEHPEVSGVIHSFDGHAQDAEDYLALGWMISLNGMVTFKQKTYLREAAAVVPAERLLVETDSPFLAPVPQRGKRCEPGFVRHTAQFLANLREVEEAELAAQTTANARRLFHLPVS